MIVYVCKYTFGLAICFKLSVLHLSESSVYVCCFFKILLLDENYFSSISQHKIIRTTYQEQNQLVCYFIMVLLMHAISLELPRLFSVCGYVRCAYLYLCMYVFWLFCVLFLGVSILAYACFVSTFPMCSFSLRARKLFASRQKALRFAPESCIAAFQ